MTWLLGTDTGADPVSAVTLTRLKPDDLARLGIEADIAKPDDFVFKKVSDNGSNMKAAWCNWADDSNWAPCIDHTIELCTLPFTYVQKRANGTDLAIPRGSVAESFSKGRGLVGSSRARPDVRVRLHKRHVPTVREGRVYECALYC